MYDHRLTAVSLLIIEWYDLTSFTTSESVEEKFNARQGGYVSFSYEFKRPCLNGGLCVYDQKEVCVCPENFSRQFCEHPIGQLFVYASHGGNLVNHHHLQVDGASDIYLKIMAVDHQGKSKCCGLRQFKIICTQYGIKPLGLEEEIGATSLLEFGMMTQMCDHGWIYSHLAVENGFVSFNYNHKNVLSMRKNAAYVWLFYSCRMHL